MKNNFTFENIKNIENLLLKFKDKYTHITFLCNQSKQELKKLTNILLKDIMANKQNLAILIIKDFKSYLEEYSNSRSVIPKENIKSIVECYRDIFEDNNIALLIKKYFSKDEELKNIIVNLEKELNLTNIRTIILSEGI